MTPEDAKKVLEALENQTLSVKAELDIAQYLWSKVPSGKSKLDYQRYVSNTHEAAIEIMKKECAK